MRVDIARHFDRTVTVVNVIPRELGLSSGEESALKSTVLENGAQWYATRDATEGDRLREQTTIYSVHLDIEQYVPVADWDGEHGYTMQDGDFVILGDAGSYMNWTELETIKATRQFQVAKVYHWTDLSRNGSLTAPRSGVLKWLESIYCEGA